VELGVHAPGGHAHGGFHEADVLGAGLQQHFLEGGGGIALEGADEAGAHLHAAGAQSQETLDVSAIPHATGHQHGEVAPLVALGHHLGEEMLQGVLGSAAALGAEALVAAAFGAFQHHGIGQSVVLALPVLADHAEGPGRGDDGHQGHIGVAHEVGQGQGQARAADDELGAAGQGGAHSGFVAFDGAEDVHAHGAAPARPLPGSADDGFERAGRIQGGGVRAAQAQHGAGRAVVAGADGGNQAHAAFGSHGARQAFPGHADAHAALLDGIAQIQVADAEAGQGGGASAQQGLVSGIQAIQEAAPEGVEGICIQQERRAGQQALGSRFQGMAGLGGPFRSGEDGEAEGAEGGDAPGIRQQGGGSRSLGAKGLFGAGHGHDAGEVGFLQKAQFGRDVGGVEHEGHARFPGGGQHGIGAPPQAAQIQAQLGVLPELGRQFLEPCLQAGGIGKGLGAGQGPAPGPQEGGLEIQGPGGLPALQDRQGGVAEQNVGHPNLLSTASGNRASFISVTGASCDSV